MPDLTVFLDIPVEEARSRGLGNAGDRMEMEQFSFYERVRAGYLRIAGAEPDRFLVLDGRDPETRLAKDILAAVQAVWDRKKSAEP